MKSKVATVVPDHYKVMDVILNYIIFDNPVPPPLQSKKYYKLVDGIVNAINAEDENLMIFFEAAITTVLQDKLTANNLVDIVKCYQCSNEKIVINKLFDLQKNSYSFALQNFPTDLSDKELANTLLVRRFFPVQIFTFLANRFAAILTQVEITDQGNITKDNYEHLKFICQQLFDVSLIIDFTTADLFSCDRSQHNFFSDTDRRNYQQWVKYELENQPKFTINIY